VIGMGLVLGGIVYWITKSPELTLVAAGAVPGAMSDHTRDLLTKIEGIEDGVRTANNAADVANGHLAALRRVTPGAEQRLPPPLTERPVIPDRIAL
jgi:hypothetical protein